MNFEDEIRETMRAHVNEAPSNSGFVMSGKRRRRASWLPAAAAAALVAAVGVTLGVYLPTRPSQEVFPVATSTDCPASHPTNDEYWVPDKPSVSGSDDRLVPNEVPQSMQICAYLGSDNGKLTGQQTVTGNFSTAAETLTWLPSKVGGGVCPLYAAVTDSDNYFIELTYADGVAWIAAPGNHCAGASNGVFETRANLRPFAADAYRSGTWLLPGLDQSALRCGPKWAPGRLGDDKAIVPGTPESVTICNDQREKTVVNPSALINELNALPTQPSSGCHPTHDPNFTMIDYDLYFNYAEGPPAVVYVTVGCAPNVDNDALQAQAGQQVVELIQQMLG